MKVNELKNDMGKMEVKEYMSSMDKIIVIRDIIEKCLDYDNDNMLIFDPFKFNIYFDMYMIKNHTNLEFENDFYSVVEAYDFLCQNNYLSDVIDTFREDYNRALILAIQEKDNAMSKDSLSIKITKFINIIADKLDAINIDELIKRIEESKKFLEEDNVKQIIDALNIIK